MRQELSADARFVLSAVKLTAYQMVVANAIGEKNLGKIAAQFFLKVKL